MKAIYVLMYSLTCMYLNLYCKGNFKNNLRYYIALPLVCFMELIDLCTERLKYEAEIKLNKFII